MKETRVKNFKLDQQELEDVKSALSIAIRNLDKRNKQTIAAMKRLLKKAWKL